MNGLITEQDAARLLGIPLRTLGRMRRDNLPKLPFCILGGFIRYNAEELIEWAKTQNQHTRRHYVADQYKRPAAH